MACEVGGGGGLDNASSCLGSPKKNRIKLLCSHGGKILPRPADGLLRYIGGETRVIAVSRDITFSGTYISTCMLNLFPHIHTDREDEMNRLIY